MMRLTNIKRLDAVEVSYPLIDALGGVSRLFNLDGKNWNCLVCIHLDCLPSENEITNKNKNTKDLNKQISFFPSFNFMAGYLRIVKFSGLVCQTKRKEYVPCVPPVFLSVKPQIILRWVVSLAALFFKGAHPAQWDLGNCNDGRDAQSVKGSGRHISAGKPAHWYSRLANALSIWTFFAEGSQIMQIAPLAHCVMCALILPYKRLAKVLQILRPEMPLVETARSVGQTLNSALNFPVWKLGKTFLSLIRLDINTDSLHISHNWGAFHRSLPFFQFLTIYK